MTKIDYKTKYKTMFPVESYFDSQVPSSAMQSMASTMQVKTCMQKQYYINNLQIEYLDSFFSYTEEPLLIHVRDLYISLCLALLTKNMQFYDSHYTKLTTHSSASLAKSRIDCYGSGFIGTLLFYLNKDVSYKELSGIQIVENCLINLWDSLELNAVNTTINSRLRSLYRKIGLLDYNWIEVEQSIKELYTTEEKFKLNRSFIKQQDWDVLKDRMLLGELNINQLEYLKEFSHYDYDEYLNVCSPAGLPLVYLAVVVESLYTVAVYINSLSVEVQLSSSLSTLQDNAVGYDIAILLASGYDMLEVLDKFSMYDKLGDYKRIFLDEIKRMLGRYKTLKQDDSGRLTILDEVR